MTPLAQVAFSEYQSFRTVDVRIGNASDDSFYHPPSPILLFRYISLPLTVLLTAQSSVPGRFFTQVSFLPDDAIDSLADCYRRFGAAGFVLFWMLNWAGMLSVGLALEAMLTLLTMKGVPFFMILLIISALIPLSSTLRGYRGSRISPSQAMSLCASCLSMYYLVYIDTATPSRFITSPALCEPFSSAPKTIVSDSPSNVLDLFQILTYALLVGLNFGVLIAWTAISCITLPFFQWFMRRKHISELNGTMEPDEKVAD